MPKELLTGSEHAAESCKPLPQVCPSSSSLGKGKLAELLFPLRMVEAGASKQEGSAQVAGRKVEEPLFVVKTVLIEPSAVSTASPGCEFLPLPSVTELKLKHKSSLL